MSKLALLQQYRYSPAAGGIFSSIAKFIGKGLGIIKPAASKAAQVVVQAAKTPTGKAVMGGAAAVAASELLRGGAGGAGASGGWSVRRRSRGITARELRGYRKVANLLHKEGMVSRRARGRK